MNVLDGKVASAFFKKAIAEEAAEVSRKIGRKPHLAAILVGNDGASETYVASKIKNCEQVGFQSSLISFPADIDEATLLAKVEAMNADTSVDGLLVQLPLPAHISAEKVTERILPTKDVDGFHPVNLGRMQRNLPAYIPATPYGIVLLLEYYQVDTSGKHCVVIGRSNIVGSPMSVLMARNSEPGNCTVTLCHSKTPDIKKFTLDADIIIAAIGKKNFVTADMIKEGAVVIDVGINRERSEQTKSGYKLYGDVDFKNVAPKTSWITPVPGGVGLMTIVGLLKNTLSAAQNKIYSSFNI